MNGVTLKDVLFFFTGTEDIPTTGYDVPPSLVFNHTDNPFPTASTCAVQLVIPTVNCEDQGAFLEKMTYALKHHGGFGKI